MAYCTVSDVQAKRPQHPITSSSKPSTAEVQTLINDLSQMVDGRLAALGFVTPITGSISTAYLRTAVSFGVAGLVELQQRAGIAAAGGDRDTAPRSIYYTLFEQMIAAVEKNENVLIDALSASAEHLQGAEGPVLASFFTKYPDDDVSSGQRGRLTSTAVPRFETRTEF